MKPPRKTENELILGLVSISDRASKGIYDDRGIPELEAWCRKTITTPITVHRRLIPDERFDIEKTLRELVDIIGCDLILTTGGTGPSRRDVTPEATLAVGTREMPGFGEQMRAISGHFVPTAILSRQVAVLRETPDHAALIINLPGQPKAIAETLEGLKDTSGKSIVNGIFAAVPYCLDLIGGPYIETDESVVKAFRPKSARKPQVEALQKEKVPEEPAAPTTPDVTPFDPKDILMVTPRRAQTPPEAVVIWLHGMGVDNTDFSPFPDEILDFGGPVCRFMLPNAPVREISAHPGYPLRAWYDVRSDKIDDNEDRLGIRETAAKIHLLIKEVEKAGIPRHRIFLGGFSQGAASALYAGLREEEPIAGIIALSGYLPLAGSLFAEITAAGRQTPVFMAHGLFDSVISPLTAQRSAQVIKELNPAFRWYPFDMDHEICQEELSALAQFIRAQL
ncbi:MAG: molybdopterin adenylyltransferase [Sutterella wadsworthensis]|nr:molybdopterin adenylyltransferase [Sutterella wadsworthensis]